MGVVFAAHADGAREDDGNDVGRAPARGLDPLAYRLDAGEGAVVHVGPELLLQIFGTGNEVHFLVETAGQQADGGEVAHDLRHVGMEGQAVEERHVDGEVRTRAPAGQHFGVGRKQEAGDGEIGLGRLLLEALPGRPVKGGLVPDEARTLDLRWRDGQRQIRRRGKGVHAVHPVGAVPAVAGALPEAVEGEHVVPEGELERLELGFGVRVELGQALHDEVHAVQVGHEQVEADVHAEGSGRDLRHGHAVERPLASGQHLVAHGLPAGEHPAICLAAGQIGEVVEGNLEIRHVGQDALAAVGHDDAPEHVVLADEAVPGRSQALDVEIGRLELEIDVAGDVAKDEGARAADPVGLLHVHELEGRKALDGVGNDLGMLLAAVRGAPADQLDDAGCQGVESRILEEEAALEADAEVLFHGLEEVQGKEAVDAQLDEVGLPVHFVRSGLEDAADLFLEPGGNLAGIGPGAVPAGLAGLCALPRRAPRRHDLVEERSHGEQAMGLSVGRPGYVADGGGASALREEAVEEGKALFRRHRADAEGLEAREACAPRGHAGFAEGAPVHGKRGQAFGAPSGRQGVQHGVGGRVAGLSGRAEPGRRGGEEHEAPEVCGPGLLPGKAVQIEGAFGLGREHLHEAGGVQRREAAVVKHAGEMPDAGKLRHALEGAKQGAFERLVVADVAGYGLHLAARPGKAFEHGLCRVVRRVPGGQDEVAASLPHAAGRQLEAKSAEAAGDEFGFAGLGPGVLRQACGGPGQDNLADVPGAGHEAEGFRIAGDGEGLDGQKVELAPAAGFQGLREGAGHHLGLFPAEHDQIDGVVVHDAFGALALALVEHAALAELDEAAAVGDDVEGRLLGLAGKGVEDDVHAPAAGGLLDLPGKVRASGAEAEAGPALEHEGALGVAAGRADDRGAEVPGYGKGRQADAAGGRMHEHGLPRLDPAKLHQAVPGGDVGNGKAGGLLHADAFGNLPDHGRIEGHVASDAAKGADGNPVAFAEALDAFADGRNQAGRVAADGGPVAGIDAHGHHDVAEVKARGADGHLHLAGTGLSAGFGDHRQAVESGALHDQGLGRAAVLLSRLERRRHQARGVDQALPHRQAALRQIAEEGFGEAGRDFLGLLDVDHANPAFGVFRGEHRHDAPEHGLFGKPRGRPGTEGARRGQREAQAFRIPGVHGAHDGEEIAEAAFGIGPEAGLGPEVERAEVADEDVAPALQRLVERFAEGLAFGGGQAHAGASEDGEAHGKARGKASLILDENEPVAVLRGAGHVLQLAPGQAVAQGRRLACGLLIQRPGGHGRHAQAGDAGERGAVLAEDVDVEIHGVGPGLHACRKLCLDAEGFGQACGHVRQRELPAGSGHEAAALAEQFGRHGGRKGLQAGVEGLRTEGPALAPQLPGELHEHERSALCLRLPGNVPEGRAVADARLLEDGVVGLLAEALLAGALPERQDRFAVGAGGQPRRRRAFCAGVQRPGGRVHGLKRGIELDGLVLDADLEEDGIGIADDEGADHSAAGKRAALGMELAGRLHHEVEEEGGRRHGPAVEAVLLHALQIASCQPALEEEPAPGRGKGRLQGSALEAGHAGGFGALFHGVLVEPAAPALEGRRRQGPEAGAHVQSALLQGRKRAVVACGVGLACPGKALRAEVGHLEGLRRSLASWKRLAGDKPLRRAACGEFGKGAGKRIPAAHGQGKAAAVLGAGLAGRAAQVHEAGLGAGNAFGGPSGQGAQHGRRPGGKRENVDGFGLGPFRRRRGHFSQDGVRVGAAYAEGADAGKAQGSFGPPFLEFRVDVEGAGVEGDGGIGLGEERVRRNLALVDRHAGLDEAGYAGGRVGMADVGLDGAEGAEALPLREVREDLVQGRKLDGVADGGAGAVGFDEAYVLGREAGKLEGFADDRGLAGFAGCGVADALRPVVVDHRGEDGAVDAVAVRQRVLEALERHDADAVGEDRARRVPVEGTAVAVRRHDHALLVEVAAFLGHVHGDAARQGQVAGAGAQRLAGEVHGRKGA